MKDKLTNDHRPDDPLDRLLTDSVTQPPEHFTDSVLSRIAEQTPFDYSQPRLPVSPKPSLWASIALATSTVVGVFQVIGFIFGLWLPVAAG